MQHVSVVGRDPIAFDFDRHRSGQVDLASTWADRSDEQAILVVIEHATAVRTRQHQHAAIVQTGVVEIETQRQPIVVRM
jgi:hypothetical protein